MSVSPAWLGVVSADALLSDLRQTSIHPVALTHINLFLDEILVLLLTNADSLNPRDLRTQAVPIVFSSGRTESTGTRALGRSAVAEAEVELRSLYDGKSGRKARAIMEGTGMRSNRPLAVQEAAEVITIRAMGLCTLCPDGAYSREADARATAAWKAAGGEEDAVDPAMYWLVAVLEHVPRFGRQLVLMSRHLCEHIIAALSRVCARDSSQSVAGPSELYTTLCEDASIWGLFKKMQVKESLEEAMRASRGKRSAGPLSPAEKSAGRMTPSGSPRIGTATPLRDGSFDVSDRSSAPPPSSFAGRTSVENRAPSSQSIRKTPSVTRRILGRDKDGAHERTGSVLSINTKSMIGAYQDSVDRSLSVRSPQEEEEDWDALMRSGETMKVSLTPSRLKTFDTGRRRQPGSPNQPTFNRSPVPPVPSMDDSPSRRGHNTNGANSSLGPTRPGNRSRSSSQAKLTARGATTIEEHEEEDDLPGARKGKKESLADMFASEPGPQSGGATKRTVPAVVLGTPPPPAPAPSASKDSLPLPQRTMTERRPSVPSLNRPQGRMVSGASMDDDDFGARPMAKRRTEAQELADFLSSTAPPASHGPLSPGSDGAKTKGLKGFMSKLAGGRQPASSKAPKIEDIPTIDPALVAAKRKQSHVPFATSSMASASSAGASPASVTSRLPSSISAPNVEASPSKPVQLRKRSDGRDALPTVQSVPRNLSGASQPAGGFTNREPHSARGSGGLGGEEVLLAAAGGLGLAATAGAAIAATATTLSPSGDKADAGAQRSNSKRKAVPAESTPGEASTVAATAASDTEQATPGPGATVAQNDSVPREASAAAPPIQQHAAVGASTSDVNSFITADEGVRTDDSGGSGAEIAPIEAQPNVPATSTAIDAASAPKETAPAAPAPAPPIPSITLAELAPLRNLLDHATSARECQLLLNAVLSQWGVPISSDQAAPTPEDRVAGWLLAGREGPGVDVLFTPASAQKGSENEQTPTQASEGIFRPIPLPGNADEPRTRVVGAGENGPGKEEILNETNGVEEDDQSIMTDSETEALAPKAKVGGRNMPGGLGIIGGQSTPAVGSVRD